MNLEQGISVVICCYNSAARLEPTLIHIAEQKEIETKVEIVLIDNNSSDGTAQVALNIWANLGSPFPLKVERELIAGLMNARRKGVEVATNSIIVFCDDDNWLNPLYLKTVYDYFMSHLDAGAIGGEGRVVSDVEIPNWFPFFSHQYACFPQSDSSLLYGAGLSVRTSLMKHIFSITPKFNLNGRIGGRLLGGDDHELVYMIRWTGFQISYVPALVFGHYMPEQRLTLTYLGNLLKGAGYSAPFLWPYEVHNYGLIRASYKVLRLFMGIPKIIIKNFSNKSIMKLRLRMHVIYMNEAIRSFIENKKSVQRIADNLDTMRIQYKLK